MSIATAHPASDSPDVRAIAAELLRRRRIRRSLVRWELDNGGEYYAAGVGTAIAGFRADGALIDDPVRSREDADSERIRDKTWDWYKSDLLTRLRPGGWVILIQTR